ncbi:hypothetical protein ACGLDV_003634 [Escherichia coli]|nr:hypothetical protein [Escherichia coli]EHE4163638.1 hypothetical protein [Escherichia coli]EJU2170649.1 hypothetical protein [Escherichia coli]EJY9609196.1 hypothetical protein [Escherichia coli]EJZ2448676.1 hypothetical protein [Escherichia coli]
MALTRAGSASLELYISGYLLWKFNLSAEIIFSAGFYSDYPAYPRAVSHVVYNFIFKPTGEQQ